MKNVLILLLSFGIYAGAVQAAEDPMQSLFKFQEKMAANGSSAAMMKLGELYEQGQGTKQDFDKAIEMYSKAKANGHTGADAAIKRVQKRKKGIVSAAEKKRKEAQARERARKQAQQRRLAAEKAAKAKAAKEKAQREAQAKKQAQQEAARKRAAAEQKRKAELEKRRLAAEQRRQDAERARLAKAKADAEAATAAKKASETKASEEKGEGFKSNPCSGPAARVMSICKGK